MEHYTSYEQMLEDRATNPRMIVCKSCDGLGGQWRWRKTSQWKDGEWITHEVEKWHDCRSCNGSGEVTPRQFDQIQD